ncbi:MAG: 50S ribosome-binding GTPase [Immundisolibacteraceae bacterium]|nr:50S ribosome-binding GTPase [Immundisolibacteraceae bacterium]
MTGDGVFAADQLFATLDPTLRKVEIADCEPLVLADTVGFVRDLPHELIEAFHSTLEEVSEATLVLHVIDSSHEEYREQQEQVDIVLDQIGADQVPQLLVYNKIDLTGRPAELERDGDDRVKAVWVSAQQGDGVELLRQAISELMTGDWRQYQLALPPAAGAMRAKIYEQGRILNESYAENGDWRVEFEMASADYQRMVSGVEDVAKLGFEV